MENLYVHQFVSDGTGWAVMGAMFAVMFGCMGSARGIRSAAAQATGVLAEKPELFGRLLVLMALPGTQGLYGLICAFLIATKVGLLGTAVGVVTPMAGVALFFIGFCMGVVQWRSAVFQGETSAACISLTGKRPEQGGRAIVLPGLVEFYAVLALLMAIILIGAIKLPAVTDLPAA